MMESDNTQQSTNASNFDVPSPDLFSDDEEEGCYEGEYSKSSQQYEASIIPLQSHQEETVESLESARLHRLLQLLQGVPPPPSKTIPQMNVSEILQRWNEFAQKDLTGSTKTEGRTDHSNICLWKPTVSLDEATSAKWPDAKKMIFHDLHYNICAASEDVERLSLKLHERYVGAETTSWCNAFSSTITNSAKKRQRTRGLGHTSPGCRLSHLARRRQTFSSANLAQLSSVAGSGTAGVARASAKGPSAAKKLLMTKPSGAQERRRIMVEIKKTDKNKRIRTNIKSTHSKSEPLPSASGSVCSIPQDKPPAQSTKRALFQSPDLLKQVASESTKGLNINPAERSKRALWPLDSHVAINEHGKRNFDLVPAETPLSKLPCPDDRSRLVRTSRSLPFSLSHSSVVNNHPSTEGSSTHFEKPTRRVSDQGPSHSISLSSLSELHKRKLYWAISQALRKEGISTKHSDFQPCATALAHHYIHVRREIDVIPASTSEHMLQVVSAKVHEIVCTHQASQAGQEENHCNERLPAAKEERSSKGLFRDATASLNVRRSLSASMSSTDWVPSDTKPQVRRVPSARKSLTFDSFETRSESFHNPVESTELKAQNNGKGNEGKNKTCGDSLSALSFKRVSRSLFLSPTDDNKVSKKEANENLNTSVIDGRAGQKDNCSSESLGNKTDTTPFESSAFQGSDISSVTNSNAVSITTDEANDDASRLTNQESHCVRIPSENGSPSNLSSSSSIATGASDKNISRVTIETDVTHEGHGSQSGLETERKQETHVHPIRRVIRRSLSLAKRDLKSNCAESVAPNGCSGYQSVANISGLNDTQEPQIGITLSPSIDAPLLEECVSQVVVTVSNTPLGNEARSPPSSKDPITTETSESSSMPKLIHHLNDGSLSDSSAAPDLHSEVSDMNKDSNTAREPKVITPLLEGAVIESPTCVVSESSSSVDTNLTFRGRIERLKPISCDDTSIDLDPNLGFNVSACILNMDEAQEKSPLLEKWAERASRSAQKVPGHCDNTESHVNSGSVLPPEETGAGVEESILVWEESQLDVGGQSSARLFEEFRNIFDSSQQGNS